MRWLKDDSSDSPESKNRINLDPKIVVSDNLREALNSRDTDYSVETLLEALLEPIMAYKFGSR